MTLPASGPLSINQIQTEFGGTNPAALSEYYRNGGLVPDTPTNINIPFSGAISIGDFYNGDVATSGDYSVTYGASGPIGGGEYFGYTNNVQISPTPPNIGSITPSDTFLGISIAGIYDFSAGGTFGRQVELVGNHPSSTFTSITINSLTLLTTAATVSFLGTNTLFQWTITAGDLITSGTHIVNLTL